MKTKINERRRREQGYALVTVMVFGTVGLVILAASINWTSSNANLIERNNQYFATLAAAEAATEKVFSEMSVDFQKQGPATVASKLATYRGRVPTASESGYWGKYTFNNGQGAANATAVSQVAPWTANVPLIAQYQGLTGFRAIYNITSNAREAGARHNITTGVGQELWIEDIPLFQFAIFYNLDLEINPGPDMTINGKVHSNGHIYTNPGASLVYNGDVAAVKDINYFRMPGDPTPPGNGTVTPGPGVEMSGGNVSLNLPIGTDNSPASVRQIVEPPPVGELASSTVGQQRFYNKADLVIVVTDTSVTAQSGALAPVSVPVPLAWTTGSGGIKGFVKTNVNFYNKREGKTVKTTEIDVALLKAWNDSGNVLKTALGRDVNSIYIDDRRSQSGSTEAGVRLINGQTLPSKGLTVATPDPLYVKGHFNAPSSALGTSDTSGTKPASLIGDSINVLSGSWNDANAGSGLSSRIAGNTTVNAAFLGGIVPTGNGNYSGGVENFPRFLEDWGGKTFTYNGSMIVMFPSQSSIAPWKAPGSTFGVYGAPTRNWNFDTAFLNPNRLPPGTPAARTISRGSWKIVVPNT